MPEIDDNTKVAIPLRNLVALGAGIVMATTAYVTLDTRITTVEHSQEIQDMNIQENSAFVREWPLGMRGALPDDLIQNAKDYGSGRTQHRDTRATQAAKQAGSRNR